LGIFNRTEPRHVHVEQAERYAKFWLEPVVLLEESRGFHSSELLRIHNLIVENRELLTLSGMSILASKVSSDVMDVQVLEAELIVRLSDGRTVSAPLAWFPRLLHGTAEQRKNWRLIGKGVGIHWPDLDEDISVRSLLATS
jgi:uncharacterized protein DUF2442/uncharacterized protein DUF4160